MQHNALVDAEVRQVMTVGVRFMRFRGWGYYRAQVIWPRSLGSPVR